MSRETQMNRNTEADRYEQAVENEINGAVRTLRPTNGTVVIRSPGENEEKLVDLAVETGAIQIEYVEELDELRLQFRCPTR